ncbi:hypothetical protein [Thermocrispum municipale]|jgi:hypothetical protein|uniref:hypothetical protein n=1 Tax=Thermocrispum municipale TaxID=37926 RepID=UPI0005B82BC2|nr:hypothetical protein [Thermocrispum municipale]
MASSASSQNDAAGGVSSIGDDSFSVAVDVAGGVRVRIEPDQILQAAKVVVEQADALSEALLRHGPLMRVGAPSQNAISKAVAEAWNDAVVDGEDSHLARAKEYLYTLRQLQQQLRQAAERYQLDDDEIAETFGERRADQAD